MHSLALRTTGYVYAWGKNDDGRCTVPVDLNGVKAVAAGESHSLAMKHNTVTCWGNADYEHCDVPSFSHNRPIAIAAGGGHSLALKVDRTVVAWGSNNFGECDVPPGLSGVLDVAAGRYHSLALKSDGTVVAWGQNTYHQCDVPAGLNHVIAVAAGGYHSLALKSDGTVVAWGSGTATNVPADLDLRIRFKVPHVGIFPGVLFLLLN